MDKNIMSNLGFCLILISFCQKRPICKHYLCKNNLSINHEKISNNSIYRH